MYFPVLNPSEDPIFRINSKLHGTLKVKSESEVTQSCPTLCDPMDCSLPGSSVHGILQARILEWVTISITFFLFKFVYYLFNFGCAGSSLLPEGSL